MKKSVTFILIFQFNAVLAAICPTDAILRVECNVKDALRHIANKHCKTPGEGAEQFTAYYCNDLVGACKVATVSPDAKYPNNCYKKGEEGEIVGYLSNGLPTNCYHVNFEPGSGMGVMKLKTMYPDRDDFCTQH